MIYSHLDFFCSVSRPAPVFKEHDVEKSITKVTRNSVKFDCRYTASPCADVVWFKDGKVFNKDNRSEKVR